MVTKAPNLLRKKKKRERFYVSVLEEKVGYNFPELEKDNAVYKEHYKLTCVDRQPALTS